MTYGEKTVAEFCLNDLKNMSLQIKPIMSLLMKTYFGSLIIKDLSWFLLNKLVSESAAN